MINKIITNNSRTISGISQQTARNSLSQNRAKTDYFSKCSARAQNLASKSNMLASLSFDLRSTSVDKIWWSKTLLDKVKTTPEHTNYSAVENKNLYYILKTAAKDTNYLSIRLYDGIS